MKTLFREWRGSRVCGLAVAIAISTLTAQAVVQIKTLGGGPNQASPARAGANNGDTLNFAKFNGPFAVAADASGNLYVADRNNGKVRKITKPGSADSLTTTFASRLRAPVGVAVDGSNVVYVITQIDGRLRKFSSNGALLETVSGLFNPTALALDGAGNVYVTELAGTVRVIAPDGSISLVTSGLNRPRGIAVLKSGLLAVSESGAHAIDLVDPLTGATTVLAGGNGRGFNDGAGATARFNQPHGLAVAPNGSIVVADRLNHRVRVIDTNGVVSTLYGIPRSQWRSPFAGWVDGPGGSDGTAAARDPVGLSVSANGAVYVTELGWQLIRQATETGLSITNPPPSGTVTNVVGTNTFVGTNIVSWGFESGVASGGFVGRPGQAFYVPVTMSLGVGQKIYTLQMSMTVTNEGPTPLDFSQLTFGSSIVTVVSNGPPQIFAPLQPNYGFVNTPNNLMGIGWITQFGDTNFYNTLAQDLIKSSLEQGHLFDGAAGRVVVGKIRFRIPVNAVPNDSYLLKLLRPSATSDGMGTDVPLFVPSDGSLQRGPVNGIKRVIISDGFGGAGTGGNGGTGVNGLPHGLYVVGDSVPFQWYNAGDFGDGYLLNGDVIETFVAAAIPGKLTLNVPPSDSDLFDAMDSSAGGSSTTYIVDDTLINNVTTGDGQLRVDDVFVTFRRSLDPTLKWFGRYWLNSVRQVIEIPNVAKPGTEPKAIVVGAAKGAAGPRPSVNVAVNDVMLTASGATLDLPLRVEVSAGYSLRVMMAGLTVEALDGSPAIVEPIQLQTAPIFQAPDLRQSVGANHYAGAWLNNTINGVSGNSTLAILTVRIPANAGARAAYRVHFDHFSASPNGLALFETHVNKALILLSDRSASTWDDGISDEWRLRYFGSIYASESAPAADADADGFLNTDEYVNGTDPTDPTSN